MDFQFTKSATELHQLDFLEWLVPEQQEFVLMPEIAQRFEWRSTRQDFSDGYPGHLRAET